MNNLASKLAQAFDTPNVLERHRYILALRAFSDLLKDQGLPNRWRRKLFELGLALGELGDGITPELLKPEGRKGRPRDEWRVWTVRSRMSHSQAANDLRKAFPELKGLSVTNLRSWQRKLDSIKPGDEFDLEAAA